LAKLHEEKSAAIHAIESHSLSVRGHQKACFKLAVLHRLLARSNVAQASLTFGKWYYRVQRQNNLRSRCSACLLSRRWKDYAEMWSRWSCIVQRSKSNAARGSQIVHRWRHVHSAKAFEVWHNGLVMRHRWEHASEMVMRRLDYGRTTMAWWRWAEEKRLRRIASKITLRWVNLAVWPAFRRWCGQGGEVKRLRRIASKITSRWAGLTVAPAWTRWCEYWGEEKRLRRIADKIVRTWQKSCLAIAWRTWTAQAAYTRACMVKIEKAVTRWHKTRTAEAWDRWAGEIEQGRMVEVSRKHCHWDDASARAHSFCCYAMT
jgi:hypothetical protein